MNKKTKRITQSALIGAMYVAFTYIANLAGLANGMIQVRFSEALSVIPAFTPCGVSGLFIGCLISNILTGAPFLDIVFGSLATLLGALGTRHFGKNRFLAAAFPILSNTVIIPPVLKMAYGVEQGYFIVVISVFIGEVISCGILGTILYNLIDKRDSLKSRLTF